MTPNAEDRAAIAREVLDELAQYIRDNAPPDMSSEVAAQVVEAHRYDRYTKPTPALPPIPLGAVVEVEKDKRSPYRRVARGGWLDREGNTWFDDEGSTITALHHARRERDEAQGKALEFDRIQRLCPDGVDAFDHMLALEDRLATSERELDAARLSADRQSGERLDATAPSSATEFDLAPPTTLGDLATWGRSMMGGDTSHMIDDAPSSPAPRRWDLQLYADGRILCAFPQGAPAVSVPGTHVVPVVEASALDAAERERDEAVEWRTRLEWARDAVQSIDATLADAKLPNLLRDGGRLQDHVATVVQRIAELEARVMEWAGKSSHFAMESLTAQGEIDRLRARLAPTDENVERVAKVIATDDGDDLAPSSWYKSNARAVLRTLNEEGQGNG